MSGPGNEPSTAHNSKIDGFVENTISSVVEFSLRYLNTIWTFLLWPFRPSIAIFQPDRARISAPLSFLFVSGSLLYVVSELLIKITQIGRKWKPNPEDPNPFADISWNTYTLDAFALYTAPIVVIVIVMAKICGWAFSAVPATRKNTREVVVYLSGYILFVLSVAVLAFVLVLTETLLAVPIPGQFERLERFTNTPVFHGLQYLLYAFLVYAPLSWLAALVSFSKAPAAAWEHTRRFARHAVLRFLVMFIVIIVCIPSGIAGTSYLILKNMRSVPDIDLWGIMVLSHDAQSLARQELPLSVAVTSTSEKTIVLFPFIKMPVRVRARDKPDGELNYTFVPRPATGTFIVVPPHGTVTIEGVLKEHDAQRQAWLDENRKKSNIDIDLSLYGGYQKERPIEVYTVSAYNYWKSGYRHGGLLFRGFAKSEVSGTGGKGRLGVRLQN